MNNQLVQSNNWLRQLVKILVSLMLILAVVFLGIHRHHNQDPYFQEVLSLEGNISKGRDIFQINCAVCHGIAANGNIGPSLRNIAKRKSKTDLITQVVSGNTPPMPKFQPNSQEMADLLSYLEQIK